MVTAMAATNFGNLEKSFNGDEIKKRSWRKEKDENFRINSLKTFLVKSISDILGGWGCQIKVRQIEIISLFFILFVRPLTEYQHSVHNFTNMWKYWKTLKKGHKNDSNLENMIYDVRFKKHNIFRSSKRVL